MSSAPSQFTRGCFVVFGLACCFLWYELRKPIIYDNRAFKRISTLNCTSSRIWPCSNVTNFLKMNTSKTSERPLDLCAVVPPNLAGPNWVETYTKPLDELEALYKTMALAPGGRFKPQNCIPRYNVAIIVPYRKRKDQLVSFIHHMHPFLQKQLIAYTIFIIEQAGKSRFNRGMLLNVGSVEALKLDRFFDCFIFHDVDLLPEDEHNLYTCPIQPRHMSVAVDSMNYKLPYPDMFGGVSAIVKEHFWGVNGFSNEYWGWGGEDDDLSKRIRTNGLYISRLPDPIGRYTMLKHRKEKPNPERFTKLRYSERRVKIDGLNSLKYRRIDIRYSKLFLWILVELKEVSHHQTGRASVKHTRNRTSALFAVQNLFSTRGTTPGR